MPMGRLHPLCAQPPAEPGPSREDARNRGSGTRRKRGGPIGPYPRNEHPAVRPTQGRIRRTGGLREPRGHHARERHHHHPYPSHGADLPSLRFGEAEVPEQCADSYQQRPWGDRGWRRVKIHSARESPPRRRARRLGKRAGNRQRATGESDDRNSPHRRLQRRRKGQWHHCGSSLRGQCSGHRGSFGLEGRIGSGERRSLLRCLERRCGASRAPGGFRKIKVGLSYKARTAL